MASASSTSWRLAPKSSAFVDIVTGEPAWFDMRVALLWDDDHLYFGFHIEEPEVWGTMTQRDSKIWEENDVEVFIAGSDGMLTAEFDRDWCEIRRNDGSVERLDLKQGDWAYKCDGPVNALIDLALGNGKNLSSGTIGAETTATIAALLASSRAGGAPQQIMTAPQARVA